MPTLTPGREGPLGRRFFAREPTWRKRFLLKQSTRALTRLNALTKPFVLAAWIMMDSPDDRQMRVKSPASDIGKALI